MAMNHAEWDALIAARERLLNAPHGAKSLVVMEAAALLGVSVPTLYRRLEEAGLDTGRKKRADAGATAMSEAELRLVSGVLFASRRDNDKQLLTVEDALDMLAASGQLQARLSPGRVGALLRAHNLHPDQLAQQRAAVQLRSLHPNHVWQIDSSTCVLYYMKSGHLAAMDADEFYANKPHNYARVLHDLCTRYIATDHTSGTFKGRYFLGGESAENVAEFMVWAVSQQPGVPMYGVPLILMLDKGPGNKSRLLLNLCKNLRVDVIHHATGNARAIGSAEKTGDIWERHFEGRFRFFNPDDLTLERINTLGCEWATHYCAQRKHSRYGLPRYSLWMGITPEQLRVPASIEVLRDLVTSVPEQRRASNERCITVAVKGYRSLSYDLSLVPGVVVGGKVTFCVNAYRAPAIDVQVVDADTGAEIWQTVEPQRTDANGFPLDAPVIGQQLRTASNTPVDDQRNRIKREAYREQGAALPSLEDADKARKRHAQAYAGVLDAMSDVRAMPPPSYMPRRGTALDTPAREVAAVVLNRVEACKRVRARLGQRYTPQVRDHVAEAYPDGVPEDRIDGICMLFATDQGVADNRHGGGLRVVGGAA